MPPERRSRSDDHSRKVVPIDRTNSLVWRGPEYPVLTPGIYQVGAIKHQGPEWVRSFHRWSIRIEFGLVAELVSVSAFFNLGNNPAGPHIGRQSRYYKAWVLANGGHPQKNQMMTADVFFENQLYEVEIANCNQDDHGKPKPDEENYSRIVRIVSVTRPSL